MIVHILNSGEYTEKFSDDRRFEFIIRTPRIRIIANQTFLSKENCRISYLFSFSFQLFILVDILLATILEFGANRFQSTAYDTPPTFGGSAGSMRKTVGRVKRIFVKESW